MNSCVHAIRIALIGLTVAAAPALAAPVVVAPVPTLKPLLVAEQCPPGYQWVAEGFIRGGKYRPARCVALVRGLPVAPSPPPPAVGQPAPRYGEGPGAPTTEQLNRDELSRVQGQGAR